MTAGEHAASLNSIRHLLAMHASWVEEGRGASEEANQVSCGEKPLSERLEGLKPSQDYADPEFRMRRTGGGGAQFSPDARPLGEGECVEVLEKAEEGQVATEATPPVSPQEEKPDEEGQDDAASGLEPQVIASSDSSNDGSELMRELDDKYPDMMAEVAMEMQTKKKKDGETKEGKSVLSVEMSVESAEKNPTQDEA